MSPPSVYKSSTLFLQSLLSHQSILDLFCSSVSFRISNLSHFASTVSSMLVRFFLTFFFLLTLWHVFRAPHPPSHGDEVLVGQAQLVPVGQAAHLGDSCAAEEPEPRWGRATVVIRTKTWVRSALGKSRLGRPLNLKRIPAPSHLLRARPSLTRSHATVVCCGTICVNCTSAGNKRSRWTLPGSQGTKTQTLTNQVGCCFEGMSQKNM